MIIDDDIDGIRVMQVCFDVIDEEIVRDARQAVDTPPVGAAIFTDLNQAIVRTA